VKHNIKFIYFLLREHNIKLKRESLIAKSKCEYGLASIGYNLQQWCLTWLFTNVLFKLVNLIKLYCCFWIFHFSFDCSGFFFGSTIFSFKIKVRIKQKDLVTIFSWPFLLKKGFVKENHVKKEWLLFFFLSF
jgi:hypothetical protein